MNPVAHKTTKAGGANLAKREVGEMAVLKGSNSVMSWNDIAEYEWLLGPILLKNSCQFNFNRKAAIRGANICHACSFAIN